MKATKILFNGDILNISANLKDNLQKSLDKCIPGAFVVKNVTVVDNVVSVTIERKCKRYYKASDGLMTLDDAIIFTGALNKGSDKKIPLGLHPFADLFNYMLHPEDLIDGYNNIMKRNNKLLDMKVESNENEVTYILTFKD